MVEQLEKQDPSAETLALTNGWKKLVKQNDYKLTNGDWKKYNPSKFYRMEMKRIEIELHQKTCKLIGKRMEQKSQETPEEKNE